ncbi:MAG TPA: response regulator [Solimonas sp.]|nr:response regulator [Solimonas sp.]
MSLPGTLSVLLVEDSRLDVALFRAVLADALQSGELRLDEAGALSEALARLAEGTYDCILLDLGLPDGRGLDSLPLVRAAAPTAAVVVLTGLDSEAHARAALRAGAQDYLVKGQYQAGVLLQRLRQAVADARRTGFRPPEA